ncbi:uncharacterized protein [Panulirus ornatus]|uniref:uncharacterized protein n=1 Tax=Panulirus ornatus TaxID=150431 RepID=UPI003A8A3DD2
MHRSEIFYPAEVIKDYQRDYGSLEEASLHPLVHRIMEEEEDFLASSPSSSPRFSRRGNRREIKKYRETTSRRTPLRGPGSWSPEMARPASMRSTCEL